MLRTNFWVIVSIQIQRPKERLPGGPGNTVGWVLWRKDPYQWQEWKGFQNSLSSFISPPCHQNSILLQTAQFSKSSRPFPSAPATWEPLTSFLHWFLRISSAFILPHLKGESDSLILLTVLHIVLIKRKFFMCREEKAGCITEQWNWHC